MIPDHVRRMAGDRRLAVWSSVLLLVVFALAGTAVFPFLTGLPAVGAVYRTPQPVIGLGPTARMPVYDFEDGSGRSLRSGVATVAEDGTIGLSRFDSVDIAADSRVAVLLPANIRTLWVMATEAERAELRHAASVFVQTVGRSVEDVSVSPLFTTEYLPVLNEAVRVAGAEAWRAPETQTAFAEVMRVADPLLRDVAAHRLRPALMDRLQPALWQAVRNNTINIWDVVTELQLDLKPFEAAVSGAIADARVRDGVSEAMATLGGTPQMRKLAEVFAGAFVRHLREDGRVADTLGRLMGDARFSPYLAPIGDPALTLARAIPRTLARLDENAELNSLAADIFKMQARGLSNHVVIFMPAAQRDRVAGVDPLAPVTLVQDARP